MLVALIVLLPVAVIVVPPGARIKNEPKGMVPVDPLLLRVPLFSVTLAGRLKAVVLPIASIVPLIVQVPVGKAPKVFPKVVLLPPGFADDSSVAPLATVTLPA